MTWLQNNFKGIEVIKFFGKKQLLVKLGVDEDTASEDACKMEHVISDQSFEAIKELVFRNG